MNGTRTDSTVTTTTSTLVYPGLDTNTPVTVIVQNGMMLMSAATPDGGLFSASLPLVAAPIMVAIAADMSELLSEQTSS